MDNELINVLIVDDEKIVREGLTHIIDWPAFGFCICGEAANGEDALFKIRKYQPGLVLLDIRMPKMYGTDLIKQVRSEGFKGNFIILSGYSDFKYAQTALHLGVSFYLTKPIDEDELISAITKVKEKIKKEKNEKNSLTQYLRKAKTTVVYDLLTGTEFNPLINYVELGLSSSIYQVIIYESYTPYFHSYSFIELLTMGNKSTDAFEHISIDNQEVILLKGDLGIKLLNSCLRHYEEGTQKGSPLDTIFLAYGPTVSNLNDLHISYSVCHQLMNRRFFCNENQHVLSYKELPEVPKDPITLTSELSTSYSKNLVNYIQAYNRRCLSEELTKLKQMLYHSGDEIMNIKYFLVDIFLQVKQAIIHTYSSIQIPFTHNAAIIELIENKHYLYEILLYFSEQFEMIMHAIGNNSSESIFDDILHYINNNYSENLKLETIAPLFGYNNSYLGKIFSRKMGQSFNTYLDHVRITEATHLLEQTNMKVYEIATKVGYKNVDYFHQKFKKFIGQTPAEYRKK